MTPLSSRLDRREPVVTSTAAGARSIRHDLGERILHDSGSRLVVFPYLNCLLDGSLQILRNPSVSFFARAPRRGVTVHN